MRSDPYGIWTRGSSGHFRRLGVLVAVFAAGLFWPSLVALVSGAVCR